MATYYHTLSNQRDLLPAPYAQLLPGTSLPLQDCINQISSIGDSDSEIVPRSPVPNLEGEPYIRSQGLSLSLGTEMASFQYPYAHPVNSSFLSSHLQLENDSLRKGSRNDDFFPCNLPLRAQNGAKLGALNGSYEPLGLVTTNFNSRYLKAAQELLDEVVGVQNALKRAEADKSSGAHGSGEIDRKMESAADSPAEISPSERQDLKNKLTKLLSMLDEVDRRYRQYQNEMKIMASSFEMVAGHGAAKPYITLALQTISCQFRRLHDAISGHIRDTQQRLGDQDASMVAGQGSLPRLRYVDQQLRQQRALQQFGVLRHSWRPQRGLPETSVSILRAWLFEHFLHPYPKDSEKLMLARQTGLTRSQVANWFINARVRLWKPMIEEIYKEEFGEVESKSSPEHGHRPAQDKPCPSEETAEELQESAKPDLIPNMGMLGCTARLGFPSSVGGNNGPDCRIMDLQDDPRPNLMTSHHPRDGNSMSAAAAYKIPELGSFPVGKQVSLVLGLQNCENDDQSMSGGMQFKGDYDPRDSLGQQQRIVHSNLLPDFVA